MCSDWRALHGASLPKPPYRVADKSSRRHRAAYQSCCRDLGAAPSSWDGLVRGGRQSFVREGAAARAVVGCPVATAVQDVLVDEQALHPHRASAVYAVGRDADLRAKAVPLAVGEARGGVHIHPRRVYVAREVLHGGLALYR